MFNIYTDEKKKKKQELKNQVLKLKDKSSALYKKLNEKMIANYQKRIKHYIIEMALNGPKVIIKDYKSAMQNSRMAYLEETSDKIKGRKGFLFGGFKSEKQRVKETVKLNEMLYGTLNPPKTNNEIEKEERRKNIIFEKHKNFSQPQMRYKPRTDLERIFELINARNTKVNYKINQNKFDKLKQENEESELNNNYLVKRNQNIKKEMSESHLIPIKKIKPKKDSEINFNSSYLSSRFLNINNEAKKLINNSKYKTNFKAVISIANDIYHSFQNNSEFKSNLSKEINYSYVPESSDYSEGNEKNDIYYDIFFKNKNKTTKNILKSYGDTSYTKNKNPNYVPPQETPEHLNKIKMLKKFAFNADFIQKNSLVEAVNNNNSVNYRKNGVISENEIIRKEEDKIVIGNETYNVNKDLYLIAKNVLNKCNIRHQKHSNSNHNLKAGEGKLMITNGMSINDFLLKYNLY